jgi:hypothetical protein
MGELSKKEKEVLNFLLEYVDFQIFCIEQQERDLGRLDYSLCSDDNEKQTVTTKKVQKFKKKISKCNPILWKKQPLKYILLHAANDAHHIVLIGSPDGRCCQRPDD